MTAPTMPSDQPVRERLAADPGVTFFVEAGAGTGKTTMLTRRVVALVAAGHVTMERLVAITFTEAAAAELRDRVRQGLERAASAPALGDAERARCQQAAADIDLAAIQTIHAFAGALLRTYPLEAGLPPGFATLDAIQQELAFDDRFRQWLYDEVPDEAQPERREAVRRAFLLGMTAAQLEELARGLHERQDLLTPARRWEQPAVPDALAAAHAIGAELLALPDFLGAAKRGRADDLAREVLRIQVAARRLADAQTEDEALLALREFRFRRPSLTAGRLVDWDPQQTLRDIRDTFRRARETTDEVLDEHRTATLAALLEHLRDFTLAHADERKRQGVATFQDLLTWARDLLRDDLDVRRRFQQRFDRVFIDEFQDTDPLQAEIAMYLAADPARPPTSRWLDLPLVPGKLFLVGDPKQSIYRFRRADIGIYTAINERFQQLGDCVALAQNFRSGSAVLRWVNAHFAQDIQADRGVQAPYTELFPQPEADMLETCGVRWFGEVLDRAGERWAREAEALAQAARGIVAGGWLVRDPETGAPRPARYADICVLLPARTNLRRLERAFEQEDVPYRMLSGSLVLDTQEIRDLLSCLRAIDDPSDQVALVAALRSPIYGCSDVELLRWVEADGKLSYEAPGAGCDGPVREALASLAALHAERMDRSAALTVEALLRERLVAVGALAEPRHREAWRRLRYVVGQARAMASSGYPTLRALLDWLEGLQRQTFYDAESPTPEADEDAVRFMTIHGAKGLEFPVVLLSGLGGERSNRGGATFLPDYETGSLEVRCGSERTGIFRTAGFDEERQQLLQRMDEAEARRLLYVAATRARDHLILSLFRDKRTCDAQRIVAVLESAPEPLGSPLALPIAALPPTQATPGEPAAPAEHEADAPKTADAQREDEERWLATRAAEIAILANEPVLTATGIARQALGIPLAFADAEPAFDDTEAAIATPAATAMPLATGEDDPAAIAAVLAVEEAGPLETSDESVLLAGLMLRGGTAIGRAVHAVMQRVDLATLADLDLLALAAARATGDIVYLTDDIVARARALAASAPVQEALATGRYWREVPVGAEVAGAVLHGEIDLLYEDPAGGLVVVDYKTATAIDRISVDTAMRHHRLQGAAYALILERALGRPVSRCVFLFVQSDGAVLERTIQDLPHAVAEVEALVQQTVAPARTME